MAALLTLAISLSTLGSSPTTTTLPPPGAGLGLIPGPTVPRPVPAAPLHDVVQLPDEPVPGHPTQSLFFAGVVAALMAALQAAAAQRRRQIAAVPIAPQDMVVVFVSGFGQELEGEFGHLVEWMGLGSDQVHYFDYRWVQPEVDHGSATKEAGNAELVDGLHAHLAGMAAMSDRPIYLVGFSKGGAAIAGLLQRWDVHPGDAIPSVIGAALLDPPIASGAHGLMQSVGSGLGGLLPNDGGYRAAQCKILGLVNCHDARIDLGKQSGVEVTVFRHEDSQLANFGDHPEGLRVYELEGGFSHLGMFKRITTAHNAVFTSPAVASCIAQEMRRARTCEWEELQDPG